MSNESLLARITARPDVSGGKPIIRDLCWLRNLKIDPLTHETHVKPMKPIGDSHERSHDRQTEFAELGQAMNMNLQSYIASDSSICGGVPVIVGTRITVKTILASLADGMDADELLAEFPTLTPAALRAVIAFAARSAEEDLPVAGVPELAGA